MTPLSLRPNVAVGLLAIGMMAFAPVADAREKSVPKSRIQITLSFAPIVEQVSTAVVNIRTQLPDFAASSPMFRDRFFGNKDPRGRRRNGSLGSGVIVRPNGMIVTNEHVIRKAAAIKVILADKREFQAKIVLKDRRTDLAILKIDGKGEKLPFLKFGDSDALEVGDLVLAIGNPFGVGQTVTSGIVSALARTGVTLTDFRFFIQTDAAINPGNSGGPLISMDGRIAGINTVIYTRTGSFVGIGWAVPSTMAKAVLRTAERGGKLKRPWLGVGGQAVNAELAKALGLKKVGGVIIRSVTKGSPGEVAGLWVNDIIISVNGRSVGDIQALRFRLATFDIGTSVTLSVIRRKKPMTVRMVLQGAPEIPPRNLMVLKGQHPMSGAQVGSLSPEFAEELGIRVISGVIIRRIRRGSISHYKGFRAGDIVLRVNGRSIKTIKDLRAALRKSADYSWFFEVRRGRLLLRRRLAL